MALKSHVPAIGVSVDHLPRDVPDKVYFAIEQNQQVLFQSAPNFHKESHFALICLLFKGFLELNGGEKWI